MLRTEEEARECWCPFVRNFDGIDVSNRYKGRFDEGTSCIGSRCMAWRWERPIWDRDQPKRPDPTSGFCGLSSSGAP